jgi:hypothetical protein
MHCSGKKKKCLHENTVSKGFVDRYAMGRVRIHFLKEKKQAAFSTNRTSLLS